MGIVDMHQEFFGAPQDPAARPARRWLRRQGPDRQPAWRWLLPAAALMAALAYASSIFARYEVEAGVLAETRAELDARGYGWVTLAVDGQRVELGGVEPFAGAGHEAIVAAQAATCPTWAGRLPCASVVAANFIGLAPGAGAATPTDRGNAP